MANLTVILSGSALLAGTSSLPFLMNWLADGDDLYTKVAEGTAKAVMRGKSLSRIIMSFQGHHLNDPSAPWYDESLPEWEVLKNDLGETYESRGWLTKKLGIYSVGIPPFMSVYNYRFAWSEMELDVTTGKEEISTRKDFTDFIYVIPFPYVLVLAEAETRDNLPVDLQYQLVVKVTNPAKALFGTENWREVVTGAANSEARNFVGSKSYQQLVSETHEPDEHGPAGPDDRFAKMILALNNHLPDGGSGLRERYGVEVVAADVQRVDPAGDNKALIEEVTVRAYVAEQDKIATIKAGEGKAGAILAEGNATAEVTERQARAEALAISLKGKAEADALVLELAAWNKGGTINAILAQTKAMAANGPGKTVIWANNPLMQQHNGLGGIFDALGLKTAEELEGYLNNLLKTLSNREAA